MAPAAEASWSEVPSQRSSRDTTRNSWATPRLETEMRSSTTSMGTRVSAPSRSTSMVSPATTTFQTPPSTS